MGIIMKFQLGDVVRKEGQAAENFVVIALRQFEPCCQIQSLERSGAKEWAISQDLELITRPDEAQAKGTAAGH
jgi:hypothetical protein